MSWFVGLIVIAFFAGVWAKLDQIQKDLFTIREEMRRLQAHEERNES